MAARTASSSPPTLTTLDDPLAVSGTYAKGINDAGQIVGYYYDANNNVHGFVDNGNLTRR